MSTDREKGRGNKRAIFCLQEEPDEHGQGKWEGKQKGKSDNRIKLRKLLVKQRRECNTSLDIT
jgi:hypothetical protein